MNGAFIRMCVAVGLLGTAACSGGEARDTNADSTEAEGALTASAKASIRAAIEASVQPLFVDTCGSNKHLLVRNIPKGLRTTFKNERKRLRAALINDDGLDASAIDDDSTYAIYKGRKILGYAVRVGGSDGSMFAGYVTAYTKDGEVLSTHNDSAQDDQDFQEEASCN